MTAGTGWEDPTPTFRETDDAEPTVDAPTAVDVEPDDEPPQLYYGSLPEFVREFFVPMFRRDVKNNQSLNWCAKWWEHPEAIYRLESLWRSWEHLRLDPALGSSTWLRDHLDHHLPRLLDPAGPFKGCKPDEHAVRDFALPIEEPAENLYVDENG
jgi:hypothetical protein